MPSPAVSLATQAYIDARLSALPSGDLVAVSTAGLGSVALAAADTTAGQPHLPTGTRVIDANVTLTKPLSFAFGAILKPAAGVTVTMPAINVGRRQIFDLSLGGAVAFTGGRIAEVYAEWWGVVFDNSTDGVANGNALRAIALMFSLVSGGRLSLPMGTCRYTGAVQWGFGVSIVGPGKPLCTMRGMDAAAHFYLYYEPGNTRRGEWGGFTVDGNGVSDFGIRWRRGANFLLSDIRVQNARTNWCIEGVQNSDLVQCDSLSTGTFTEIGVRVTDGAQHINWYGGTVKDAQLANLYVTQDITPGTGEAAQPEHITFHGDVIERGVSNNIIIDAGSPVRFRSGSASGAAVVNGQIVVRRRVKAAGGSCCRVAVVVDDLAITGGNYSIDGKAASDVGAPASVSGKPATVWATAITPIVSYPIAQVFLVGNYRQGPVLGVVHTDDGIDVGGSMKDAQSSVPLVVPVAGSTKAKLSHGIYSFGTFQATFSDTGTGATLFGSFALPILHACELLETVIAVTGAAPSSPITVTPKRIKAAGGTANIYTVAPALVTPDKIFTALVAKPTETLFVRGDLVIVDTLAPANRDFTVTMRWRRT